MPYKLELKAIPGIYIFTNKVNGKVYVGESMNIKQRFYLYRKPIPNRPFHHALLKYGFDGFDIKIMYYPNYPKHLLLDLEETLIMVYDSLITQNGYNICSRGQDRTGMITSAETRKKISQSTKGHIKSVEHRNNLSIANTGKRSSIETRRRMSLANTKKTQPKSIQHRENISKGLTGRILSEEHCLNISKGRKGMKLSEEHRKKLCESSRKGKPLSEEHRRKISEAKRTRDLLKREQQLFKA